MEECRIDLDLGGKAGDLTAFRRNAKRIGDCGDREILTSAEITRDRSRFRIARLKQGDIDAWLPCGMECRGIRTFVTNRQPRISAVRKLDGDMPFAHAKGKGTAPDRPHQQAHEHRHPSGGLS